MAPRNNPCTSNVNALGGKGEASKICTTNGDGGGAALTRQLDFPGCKNAQVGQSVQTDDPDSATKVSSAHRAQLLIPHAAEKFPDAHSWQVVGPETPL
mmetsp:Transcript_37263/g.54678  ORF Transcript_37263/g.54678 Transcript_37263/m.54678 type:complete len:98 (-) Transcript_37263:1928-2221(-)